MSLTVKKLLEIYKRGVKLIEELDPETEVICVDKNYKKIEIKDIGKIGAYPKIRILDGDTVYTESYASIADVKGKVVVVIQ